MKKLLSVILCMVTLFSFSAPCYAASDIPSARVLSKTTEQLGDGITVTTTIMEESLARSSSKTATNQKEYSRSGSVIAVVAIKGTFNYDGSSVSVSSKSVSRKDMYNGYTYTQNSFKSSGGTITLAATLEKSAYSNVAVDMTLSCDRNGNISY